MEDVHEAITARSWLFAPGDSAHKLAKAIASEADSVLIDLEDAVAEAMKPNARAMAAATLAEHPEARAMLWVRINPLSTPHAAPDLAAVMPARPAGIMLPKAAGRGDIIALDALLAAHEAALGIARGATRIIALITETAAAMFRTGDYAADGHAYPDAGRLAGLSWGAEDLAAALGAATNREADGAYRFTYQLARSLTLLGAAAAGVAAIETIHGDFRDLAGLAQRARRAREDGFAAMLAIHPAQVPVINAAFTPSEAEVAAARAIVAAFAESPGVGVIAYDGAMLDRPHLIRAETTLKRAEKLR